MSMVDYITLEELLRDKEVYDFLKARYDDRLPRAPASEVIDGSDDPVDISAPELGSTEDLSNQGLSPTCEPTPKTPSPTYSFPSISEDEAGTITECDPANSPPLGDKQEEQQDQIATEPAMSEDNDTVENMVIVNGSESISSIAPDDNTASAEDKTKAFSSDCPKNTTPATDLASEALKYKHRTKKPIPRGGAFKPPPIFIMQSERKWYDLVPDCHERNIKFKYHKKTSNGVKVVVATLEDLHELVKILTERKIRYQTAAENKVFMAALRYVPKEITDVEIRRALLEEGIPVLEVIRKPCQLKHLRATHDMIVVRVAWGYAGRQIFRYNPLHDLYESRKELFNPENISPFEKYPFITNAGLCHYKPAELFGIVTGGIMETIKPFKEIQYPPPFVLRKVDDKIASNFAQHTSNTDTTKDNSSNTAESVSVQAEINSGFNESTSAKNESSENNISAASNLHSEDSPQASQVDVAGNSVCLSEEHKNEASDQKFCSNEENNDNNKVTLQMKEDLDTKEISKDNNQAVLKMNEEDSEHKGNSNGEDSNKSVETQTNKEELEQNERSNAEYSNKHDLQINQEDLEQKDCESEEEIALMNELIRIYEGNTRVLVYVGMKFPHLIEKFKACCIKADNQ